MNQEKRIATRGQQRTCEPKLRERILDWTGRAHAEGLRDADCSRLLDLSAPQFNAWRQLPAAYMHAAVIAADRGELILPALRS